MQTKPPSYLHLAPGAALPPFEGARNFKAILIVEAAVDELWQCELSRRLAASTCRCLMAWGTDCEAWHDALDEAKLEAFDYEEVPEDESLTTTWHAEEELEEVFWFAKNCASHPVHQMKDVVIVHIAERARREELEALYAAA